MKAYSFAIAPCLVGQLAKLGYDTLKLGNAVEADGNKNLVITDESTKSSNRYTPARETTKSVKPGKSNATSTRTIKLSGDDSLPRQFAAWHDDTVKMIGKYGQLAALPLPVGIRAWLDSKFKGKVEMTPTLSAAGREIRPATNGNGNGAAPAPTEPATK